MAKIAVRRCTYTNVVRAGSSSANGTAQSSFFRKPVTDVLAKAKSRRRRGPDAGRQAGCARHGVYGATSAPLNATIDPARRQKKAGAKPALKHWGLNRTRYKGPDPLSPGGWGAEDPELVPGPGLRQHCNIAIQWAVHWTEFGPYCGSPHEAVNALG